MAEQGVKTVLVIGATGYIGRYIAFASAAAGHTTSALVRLNTPLSPEKSKILDSLQAAGVKIVHGSLEDRDSLISALKNIHIVISAVGIPQILDQLKLIDAMSEIKTIKRFIPSEFGQDVDKVVCLKPCQEAIIEPKVRVRRATEEAGIPHTYIITNGFAKFHFNMREENGKLFPPSGRFVIYGDGNTKASFVAEEDIGTYTVKAADDTRTLNKTLYIRPPANALTQNETVAILENVTKQTLHKEFVSAEELLKQMEEASGTFRAVILSLMHSAYVKGHTFSFQLGPKDVLAHELYPDIEPADAYSYLSKLM